MSRAVRQALERGWRSRTTKENPTTDAQRSCSTSYIGYLDPVTLVSRAKLTLNRSNDSYYQNHLVPLGRLPSHGINASERLLRRAFHWFKERLAGHAGGSGEATARFVDRVVDRLVFTTITVADGVNAFKVFETLNARGVRLSATDLLKNLLFSVVVREGTHESEINALERRWETVVGLLGGESFPEFLRVFWNSRHVLVRKASLFKTISAAVRDRADAFALVRSLEEDARVYAALRSPKMAFGTPPKEGACNSWSTESQANCSTSRATPTIWNTSSLPIRQTKIGRTSTTGAATTAFIVLAT